MNRRATTKTKEELNAIKQEVEAMNKKLAELTEDELKQVIGSSSADLNCTKRGLEGQIGSITYLSTSIYHVCFNPSCVKYLIGDGDIDNTACPFCGQLYMH